MLVALTRMCYSCGVVLVGKKKFKTRNIMHSLEANASPAEHLFAAKCHRRCHIPVASQDISGGRMSPKY